MTVLITGATDGLGRALAHRLAADGTDLILHGRDSGRLDATAGEIRDAHGGKRPHTVIADLSHLDQVRAMAEEVRATTERLDGRR
jgi:short-subunit dehydrogenase